LNQKIIKKESIDAGLLEKFAKALNIPITTFFDEITYPKIDQNGTGNIIGNQQFQIVKTS